MPSKDMNIFANEDLVRLRGNSGEISQDLLLGRVSQGELLGALEGRAWGQSGGDKGGGSLCKLWKKPWKYLEEGTEVYLWWGSLQCFYEGETARNGILCRFWRSYWRDRKNVHGILKEEAGYIYIFFFFFLVNLFIYLFLSLAVLGVRCCVWAFSSCSERGLLFVVVRGLPIGVASLVAEHGLQARRLL